MKTDFSKLTVLYVEDETIIRENIADIFQELFATLYVAANGEEGLALFSEKKDKIDVVISDIQMPVMNGLEMAKAIKAIKSDQPVIFTTAFNDATYLFESINIGIDAYTEKPIDIELLLASVNRVMVPIMQKNALVDQAFNDQLTGLKNRLSLNNMLEKALQSSLILIDIDNFKTINDLYGTDVGNFVLQKFAKFLQYNQPQDSEIYRIGSDDFAILNFQHFSEEKLLSVINNLTHKISEYYIFHDALDIDIDINVTMGISHEKKKSLESADIALKEAKEHGKNYIFYSEEINHKKIYEKDIQWAKLIKYAIKSNNIFPMFQPIVNSDGKTIKYESLMRIKESGTVFSPFHFIPIAKKTKQYTKLTILMLNHVFDQIGRCEVPISINLSVLDILDQEIVDYILTRLKDGGENVIFELVESESFENIEEVSHFIQQVKALGSRIAIDDFGTGYSNFSYLLQLEPDFIKIDGSLIKNIDHDKNSRIVTETVVDFANKLGIETIAEFVHSEEVFETVKAIGVSQFQGYYFSEPKEII